ncbi:type IV pilus assembly protein PilM [Alginatibacterium sediminis]|uniref:Type IV pilus assembly protein PilM n=1 Tax=Alginatibacterium sediminis TaxID=2164068 RepID=A0A420EKX8_9ALTE|nr:type IV pilus assembly protein PilM [Alginatibacterium sediminis]
MFGFGKRSSKNYLGLDMGSSSLKALLVRTYSSGLVVEDFAEVLTPKGSLVDHQLIAPDELSIALKQLHKRLNSNVRDVSSAVAGSQVITKLLQLDANLNTQELEQQVEMEAENSIPFPIDEVSIDFEILGPMSSDDTRNTILLSATRTESISLRTEIMLNADFDAKIMDVESHALGRAWSYIVKQGEFGHEVLDDDVIGLIDIGANALTFAALEAGEVIYSRSQNFGGTQYNQQIANYYGMSLDEAEEAKKSNSLPDTYEIDVLSQFVTGLLQQIRRQLQLFTSSTGNREVKYIALSGGSALGNDVFAQLEDELEYDVVVAQPFVNASFTKGVNSEHLKRHGGKYMVALGLALRGSNDV